MKNELKKRKRLFNVLVTVYFVIFFTIVFSIAMLGYLFYHGAQIEDYCLGVANRRLAQNPNHPEWVKPPSWYQGTVKDKMGYGYYLQLECGGKKFGLFEKVPQN